MSALNISETESLGIAMQQCHSTAVLLKRKQEAAGEGEPITLTANEVKILSASLADAESRVKTVRTMKGYYPNY